MKSSGKSGLLAMAAMAAMGTGIAEHASKFVFRGYGKFANSNTSRSTKRYPSMVVSSPAEIAEWNSKVKTRQVLRNMSRHAY